ncbi:MAG: TM2 domain-containing protein [Alphaproteobacteria bacterium]|nr:TM2 domain-containing protein [Alphaproteobacteria bacterium]
MKTENKTLLINMWKNKLSNVDLVKISQNLDNTSDGHLENLMLLPLKNPILTFILSITLGMIGVDRFYLGDVLKGIIKLFCFLAIFLVVFMAVMFNENIIFGIFVPYAIVFIWYFLDLYLTFKKSKKINFNAINKAVEEQK